MSFYYELIDVQGNRLVIRTKSYFKDLSSAVIKQLIIHKDERISLFMYKEKVDPFYTYAKGGEKEANPIDLKAVYYTDGTFVTDIIKVIFDNNQNNKPAAKEEIILSQLTRFENRLVKFDGRDYYINQLAKCADCEKMNIHLKKPLAIYKGKVKTMTMIVLKGAVRLYKNRNIYLCSKCNAVHIMGLKDIKDLKKNLKKTKNESNTKENKMGMFKKKKTEVISHNEEIEAYNPPIKKPTKKKKDNSIEQLSLGMDAICPKVDPTIDKIREYLIKTLGEVSTASNSDVIKGYLMAFNDFEKARKN
jgi:hypothetical protein